MVLRPRQTLQESFFRGRRSSRTCALVYTPCRVSCEVDFEVDMTPGDRFRVRPRGGYDEHLWGKTGTVKATFLGGATGRTMVKAKLDEPSTHPDVPITVDEIQDYLDVFELSVEKI